MMRATIQTREFKTFKYDTLRIGSFWLPYLGSFVTPPHFARSTGRPDMDFIPQNVFIDEFEKVNSPTKSSTYC